MSTILKTLKKLEEEKSVLEQPLGIEGMVTKGDTGHPSWFSEELIKFGWIVGLLSGAGILGGFLYYLNEPKLAPPPGPKPVLSLPESSLAVFPKVQPEMNTVSGVSMAGIQGKKTPNRTNPIKVETISETVPIELEPPLAKSETVAPPSMQDILTILESEPENAPPKKIRDLLKSVEIAVAKEPQMGEPEPRTNGHIPDFSIKGIIFFSEGNPANYIFAATPQSSSQKLKTGDQIQGATLKSIHPDHVIFNNQGRFIAVGMGG